MVEQHECLSHHIDGIWTWQGQMIQGCNDRQGFVALKTEYQKVLTWFVDQGNAIQKGAGSGKISSDALYLYRDHRHPPFFFLQNVPNFPGSSQGFCPS